MRQVGRLPVARRVSARSGHARGPGPDGRRPERPDGGGHPGGMGAGGRASGPGSTRHPLLTGADRIVLYTLVIVGVGLLLVPTGSGEAGLVRIEGAGGFETTVPLSRDGRIEVPGPLGTTTVLMEDEAVRVESSPCRHRLCVGMGRAARPGAVIVCVPNQVVVRVLGESEGAHDVLTR